MPGFEALYKQTVTLFNRKDVDGVTFWYPTVIEDVHLIIDRSTIIATYGEQASDNAELHIRYLPDGDSAIVADKVYMRPKEFRASGDPETNLTFAFGEDFDFIMAGVYEGSSPINDEEYRNGFFNYMNKAYDEVFAITSVSKFNLIPHFEIAAR
jgi:hypothetical protein